MSIFNDSAAGRSFTISGFVLEAIPAPSPATIIGLFPVRRDSDLCCVRFFNPDIAQKLNL
jgi:hypothetical protein